MAKKKNGINIIKNLLLIALSLVIGMAGGGYGFVIIMPDYFEEIITTDELVEHSEVYYTNKATNEITVGGDYSQDDLTIHFLELGNKYAGDCIFINYGDIDILIDCGSKSNSISRVTSYINNFVLDNSLEYVFITHAHEDHYAGFATDTKTSSIFDLYECNTIIDFAQTNQKSTGRLYSNYVRELADEVANGANHYTALECWQEINGATKTFDLGGGVSIEILYQRYYEEKATTENNYSVCFLLKDNDKSFLFTGDLEKEGELSLIESNSLSKVDLYKAGHHGSKTSSSKELLEVINPTVIVVCCCAGSSEYTSKTENQFPTQEFIDNVANYTDCTQVYVTSLCVDYKNNLFESMNGDVVIISGENLGVKCSNNPTSLKDTLWLKSNRTVPLKWAS